MARPAPAEPSKLRSVSPFLRLVLAMNSLFRQTLFQKIEVHFRKCTSNEFMYSLNFYHRHHAAPTDDIDRFGRPNSLTTPTRADQFPCRAGTPFLRCETSTSHRPGRSLGNLQLRVAFLKSVGDKFVVPLPLGVPAAGTPGVDTHKSLRFG